jgi:hypothetical protein
VESSASSIIGIKLSEIAGVIIPIDRSLDSSNEQPLYKGSALRVHRPPVADPLLLPSLEFAQYLFHVQYTYIGTIFAFVDPESFNLQLQVAYRGPPDMSDREACLAYSKVLTVLAFGQLYSVNQWNGSREPPGFHFFTHAMHYLPGIHEESSVLFVETLALVGYFMQNLNRKDAAFLYVGAALQMAISLALHQEVSSSGLDCFTKEHRRRLWWSVYSLERILCVKSGNPITIQDKDIGVNLPSKLPNEPEYCPAVVLRHYTELSRILTQIMKKIYRKTPKSGFNLMAAVKSITTSLGQWHQGIPDELRFRRENSQISRESVSTLLHYYQCINMTVRPLLFHVVERRLKGTPADKEKDWRHELSPNTIDAIEMCMSAAQDTISMMEIAAQKDLVGKYNLIPYLFCKQLIEPSNLRLHGWRACLLGRNRSCHGVLCFPA